METEEELKQHTNRKMRRRIKAKAERAIGKLNQKKNERKKP
jgi:hypothetical protein